MESMQGQEVLMVSQKPVMSLAEAAEFLGLSQPTVKAMAERSELPGRKFGNRWRFLREALEDHLRQPATKAA